MNVGFLELDPHAYPFTISVFRQADVEGLEPIFREVVTGPGALTIPALRKEGDPPVWMRIEWPNGEVTEYGQGLPP